MGCPTGRWRFGLRLQVRNRASGIDHTSWGVHPTALDVGNRRIEVLMAEFQIHSRFEQLVESVQRALRVIVPSENGGAAQRCRFRVPPAESPACHKASSDGTPPE